MSDIKGLLASLQDTYHIQFENIELFEEALTQSNFLNEHPELKGRDYQRLEFLGDSVMQLAVATYLYNKYPNWHEGQLTELRISMVQSLSFAHFARQIQLDKYVRIGKGEEQSGARNRDSLLEDVFEAFIGALYSDQGIESVNKLLEQTLFAAEVQGYFDQFVDYKSKLQEKLQQVGRINIDYQVVNRNENSDGTTEFQVRIVVDGNELSTGNGSSIKKAEKDAARKAYREIQ